MICEPRGYCCNTPGFVYMATEGREDKESERTARDIACNGNSSAHGGNAIDCLSLEAQALVG